MKLGRRIRVFVVTALHFAALMSGVRAQEKGSLEPKALPPITNIEDPSLAAKQLFGRANSPASLEARSIGFYSKGCLAGAQALPVNGEAWQVMRLSRNRNWANPALIDYLEGFAVRAKSVTGWPGILVGDISQPRGGPMITGHASHQIGLDADIWLTPMPNHRLSREEREEMSALNMVSDDRLSVNANWTPSHVALIKAAAQDTQVERIFVNAAIKKALCESPGDHGWLHKVRPYYGHDYHFHVRISCPEGSDNCQSQDPVPVGDGCDASLEHWFSDEVLHPPKPAHPGKPKPPLTLAQLPQECRQVLLAK